MLVKFDKNQIYHMGFGPFEEFRLRSMDVEHRMGNDLDSQKVTLSLKYNKRRKLVKGQLVVRIEYYHTYSGGYCLEYSFVPNNREKLLKILAR